MFGKGYFIKIIEKEREYIFQLCYASQQEMGSSKAYKTYGECVEQVENFKKYLIEMNPTEENGLARIIKLDARKIIYEFVDENQEVLYRSRMIEAKENCKKSLRRTCEKFVDAEII